MDVQPSGVGGLNCRVRAHEGGVREHDSCMADPDARSQTWWRRLLYIIAYLEQCICCGRKLLCTYTILAGQEGGRRGGVGVA